MSLKTVLDKVPWVIIFVVGVQFHFLAVIFPETRDYSIHLIGISIAVISACLILILYTANKRDEKRMSDLESLR
ncbi:hypothetical protein [Nitrosopumilus sp. S4]